MDRFKKNYKPILWLVIIAFLFNTIITEPVFADVPFLPAPGRLVSLTPTFAPTMMLGLKVFKDNPFKFEFIMSQGENAGSENSAAKRIFLKEEANKLVKYFLASLAVPEKDMWVNLSPYKSDRIISPEFGMTEMGKELLAQDYLLKQVTASVMYPEGSVGKEFWGKIYQESYKRFGTTNIPVDTFNKVWILPESAEVYENAVDNTAVIVKSNLKVMLEEDFLAAQKSNSKNNSNKSRQLSNELIREVILPLLKKEVNSGKNFAPLRQVYNSLILAFWFKKKLRESLISQGYVDRKKTNGVDVSDKNVDQEIYGQYLKSYKKGVYNYIREDLTPTNEIVSRKYFSGGVHFGKNLENKIHFTKSPESARAARQELKAPGIVVDQVGIAGSFAPNILGTLPSDSIFKPAGQATQLDFNFFYAKHANLNPATPPSVVTNTPASVLPQTPITPSVSTNLTPATALNVATNPVILPASNLSTTNLSTVVSNSLTGSTVPFQLLSANLGNDTASNIPMEVDNQIIQNYNTRTNYETLQDTLLSTNAPYIVIVQTNQNNMYNITRSFSKWQGEGSGHDPDSYLDFIYGSGFTSDGQANVRLNVRLDPNGSHNLTDISKVGSWQEIDNPDQITQLRKDGKAFAVQAVWLDKDGKQQSGLIYGSYKAAQMAAEIQEQANTDRDLNSKLLKITALPSFEGQTNLIAEMGMPPVDKFILDHQKEGGNIIVGAYVKRSANGFVTAITGWIYARDIQFNANPYPNQISILKYGKDPRPIKYWPSDTQILHTFSLFDQSETNAMTQHPGKAAIFLNDYLFEYGGNPLARGEIILGKNTILEDYLNNQASQNLAQHDKIATKQYLHFTHVRKDVGISTAIVSAGLSFTGIGNLPISAIGNVIVNEAMQPELIGRYVPTLEEMQKFLNEYNLAHPQENQFIWEKGKIKGADVRGFYTDRDLELLNKWIKDRNKDKVASFIEGQISEVMVILSAYQPTKTDVSGAYHYQVAQNEALYHILAQDVGSIMGEFNLAGIYSLASGNGMQYVSLANMGNKASLFDKIFSQVGVTIDGRSLWNQIVGHKAFSLSPSKARINFYVCGLSISGFFEEELLKNIDGILNDNVSYAYIVEDGHFRSTAVSFTAEQFRSLYKTAIPMGKIGKISPIDGRVMEVPVFEVETITPSGERTHQIMVFTAKALQEAGKNIQYELNRYDNFLKAMDQGGVILSYGSAGGTLSQNIFSGLYVSSSQQDLNSFPSAYSYDQGFANLLSIRSGNLDPVRRNLDFFLHNMQTQLKIGAFGGIAKSFNAYTEDTVDDPDVGGTSEIALSIMAYEKSMNEKNTPDLKYHQLLTEIINWLESVQSAHGGNALPNSPVLKEKNPEPNALAYAVLHNYGTKYNDKGALKSAKKIQQWALGVWDPSTHLFKLGGADANTRWFLANPEEFMKIFLNNSPEELGKFLEAIEKTYGVDVINHHSGKTVHLIDLASPEQARTRITHDNTSPDNRIGFSEATGEFGVVLRLAIPHLTGDNLKFATNTYQTLGQQLASMADPDGNLPQATDVGDTGFNGLSEIGAKSLAPTVQYQLFIRGANVLDINSTNAGNTLGLTPAKINVPHHQLSYDQLIQGSQVLVGTNYDNWVHFANDVTARDRHHHTPNLFYSDSSKIIYRNTDGQIVSGTFVHPTKKIIEEYKLAHEGSEMNTQMNQALNGEGPYANGGVIFETTDGNRIGHQLYTNVNDVLKAVAGFSQQGRGFVNLKHWSDFEIPAFDLDGTTQSVRATVIFPMHKTVLNDVTDSHGISTTSVYKNGYLQFIINDNTVTVLDYDSGVERTSVSHQIPEGGRQAIAKMLKDDSRSLEDRRSEINKLPVTGRTTTTRAMAPFDPTVSSVYDLNPNDIWMIKHAVDATGHVTTQEYGLFNRPVKESDQFTVSTNHFDAMGNFTYSEQFKNTGTLDKPKAGEKLSIDKETPSLKAQVPVINRVDLTSQHLSWIEHQDLAHDTTKIRVFDNENFGRMAAEFSTDQVTNLDGQLIPVNLGTIPQYRFDFFDGQVPYVSHEYSGQINNMAPAKDLVTQSYDPITGKLVMQGTDHLKGGFQDQETFIRGYEIPVDIQSTDLFGFHWRTSVTNITETGMTSTTLRDNVLSSTQSGNYDRGSHHWLFTEKTYGNGNVLTTSDIVQNNFGRELSTESHERDGFNLRHVPAYNIFGAQVGEEVLRSGKLEYTYSNYLWTPKEFTRLKQDVSTPSANPAGVLETRDTASGMTVKEVEKKTAVENSLGQRTNGELVSDYVNTNAVPSIPAKVTATFTPAPDAQQNPDATIHTSQVVKETVTTGLEGTQVTQKVTDNILGATTYQTRDIGNRSDLMQETRYLGAQGEDVGPEDAVFVMKDVLTYSAGDKLPFKVERHTYDTDGQLIGPNDMPNYIVPHSQLETPNQATTQKNVIYVPIDGHFLKVQMNGKRLLDSQAFSGGSGFGLQMDTNGYSLTRHVAEVYYDPVFEKSVKKYDGRISIGWPNAPHKTGYFFNMNEKGEYALFDNDGKSITPDSKALKAASHTDRVEANFSWMPDKFDGETKAIDPKNLEYTEEREQIPSDSNHYVRGFLFDKFNNRVFAEIHQLPESGGDYYLVEFRTSFTDRNTYLFKKVGNDFKLADDVTRQLTEDPQKAQFYRSVNLRTDDAPAAMTFDQVYNWIDNVNKTIGEHEKDVKSFLNESIDQIAKDIGADKTKLTFSVVQTFFMHDSTVFFIRINEDPLARVLVFQTNEKNDRSQPDIVINTEWEGKSPVLGAQFFYTGNVARLKTKGEISNNDLLNQIENNDPNLKKQLNNEDALRGISNSPTLIEIHQDLWMPKAGESIDLNNTNDWFPNVIRFIEKGHPISQSIAIFDGSWRLPSFEMNGNAPLGISSGEIIVQPELGRITRKTEFLMVRGDEYIYRVPFEYKEGQVLIDKPIYIAYNPRTRGVREIYLQDDREYLSREYIPSYESHFGSVLLDNHGVLPLKTPGNSLVFPNESLVNHFAVTFQITDKGVFKLVRDVPDSPSVKKVNIKIFDGNNHLVAIAAMDENASKSWYYQGLQKIEGIAVKLYPYQRTAAEQAMDLARNSFPGRIAGTLPSWSKNLTKQNVLDMLRNNTPNNPNFRTLKSFEIPASISNHVYVDHAKDDWWKVAGGLILLGGGLLTGIAAARKTNKSRSISLWKNKKWGSIDAAMVAWMDVAEVLHKRLEGLDLENAQRLAKKLASRNVQAGPLVAGKRPDLEHLFTYVDSDSTIKSFIDENNRDDFKRAYSFDEQVSAISYKWPTDENLKKMTPGDQGKWNFKKEAFKKLLDKLENDGTIEQLEDAHRDGRVVKGRLMEDGFEENDAKIIADAYEKGILNFNEKDKDLYDDQEVASINPLNILEQIKAMSDQGVPKAVAILDLLDVMKLNDETKEKRLEEAFSKADQVRSGFVQEAFNRAVDQEFEQELFRQIESNFTQIQRDKLIDEARDYQNPDTNNRVRQLPFRGVGAFNEMLLNLTDDAIRREASKVKDQYKAKEEDIKVQIRKDIEGKFLKEFGEEYKKLVEDNELRKAVNARFEDEMNQGYEREYIRLRENVLGLASQSFFAGNVQRTEELFNKVKSEKGKGLRDKIEAENKLSGVVLTELYKQIEVAAEKQGANNHDILKHLMTPEARLAVQLLKNNQPGFAQKLTTFKNFKMDVMNYVKDKVLSPHVDAILKKHAFTFLTDESRELFKSRVLAELLWYAALKPSVLPKGPDDMNRIVYPNTALPSSEPVTNEEYVVFKYLQAPKEQTGQISLGGDGFIYSEVLFLTRYFIHNRNTKMAGNEEVKINEYHNFIKNNRIYLRYMFFLNNLKQLSEQGFGAYFAISDPKKLGFENQVTPRMKDIFHDEKMMIFFADMTKRLPMEEISSSDRLTYNEAVFNEYEADLKSMAEDLKLGAPDRDIVIENLAKNAKDTWTDYIGKDKPTTTEKFDIFFKNRMEPLFRPFLARYRNLIKTYYPAVWKAEEATGQSKGLVHLMGRVVGLFAGKTVKFPENSIGRKKFTRLQDVFGIRSAKKRVLVYTLEALGVAASIGLGVLTGQVGLVVFGLGMSLITLPLSFAHMPVKGEKVLWSSVAIAVSTMFGGISWLVFGKYGALDLFSAGTFNSIMITGSLSVLGLIATTQIIRAAKAYYTFRSQLWSSVARARANIFKAIFPRASEEQYWGQINKESMGIENNYGYVMPNNVLVADHLKSLLNYLLKLGRINEREYELAVRAVYLGQPLPHFSGEKAREYMYMNMRSIAQTRVVTDPLARLKPMSTHIQSYNELVSHSAEEYVRRGTMPLVLDASEEKGIENIIKGSDQFKKMTWMEGFKFIAGVMEKIKSAPSATIKNIEKLLNDTKLDKQIITDILKYLKKMDILHGGLESNFFGFLARHHELEYSASLDKIRNKGIETLKGGNQRLAEKYFRLADDMEGADERFDYLTLMNTTYREIAPFASKVIADFLDEIDPSNLSVLAGFARDRIAIHLAVAANEGDIEYRQAIQLADLEFGSLQTAYDQWKKDLNGTTANDHDSLETKLKRALVDKFENYQKIADLKIFEMLQMTSMWQHANSDASPIRRLKPEEIGRNGVEERFVWGIKPIAQKIIGSYQYSVDEFKGEFTVNDLVTALRNRGIDIPDGSNIKDINDKVLKNKFLYKRYSDVVLSDKDQNTITYINNTDKPNPEDLMAFNRSLIDRGDSKKSPKKLIIGKKESSNAIDKEFYNYVRGIYGEGFEAKRIIDIDGYGNERFAFETPQEFADLILGFREAHYDLFTKDNFDEASKYIEMINFANVFRAERKSSGYVPIYSGDEIISTLKNGGMAMNLWLTGGLSSNQDALVRVMPGTEVYRLSVASYMGRNPERVVANPSFVIGGPTGNAFPGLDMYRMMQETFTQSTQLGSKDLGLFYGKAVVNPAAADGLLVSPVEDSGSFMIQKSIEPELVATHEGSLTWEWQRPTKMWAVFLTEMRYVFNVVGLLMPTSIFRIFHNRHVGADFKLNSLQSFFHYLSAPLAVLVCLELPLLQPFSGYAFLKPILAFVALFTVMVTSVSMFNLLRYLFRTGSWWRSGAYFIRDVVKATPYCVTQIVGYVQAAIMSANEYFFFGGTDKQPNFRTRDARSMLLDVGIFKVGFRLDSVVKNKVFKTGIGLGLVGLIGGAAWLLGGKPGGTGYHAIGLGWTFIYVLMGSVISFVLAGIMHKMEMSKTKIGVSVTGIVAAAGLLGFSSSVLFSTSFGILTAIPYFLFVVSILAGTEVWDTFVKVNHGRRQLIGSRPSAMFGDRWAFWTWAVTVPALAAGIFTDFMPFWVSIPAGLLLVGTFPAAFRNVLRSLNWHGGFLIALLKEAKNDLKKKPAPAIKPENPSQAKDNPGKNPKTGVDKAMQGQIPAKPVKEIEKLANPGGVDFTKTEVKVNAPNGEIKITFNNPEMLRLLLNADGLAPIIYDVKTMTPAMADHFVGMDY